MTNIETARESATKLFLDTWLNRTPATLENEETALDQGKVSWIRHSVRQTGGGQETLGRVGNRRYRRSASVFVQIFTPVNEGKATADGHATFARNIFEGVSFEGLDFDNVLVREAGQDGRWDITIVEALFTYEEIK